jgi:hypothetical protein
MGDVHNPDIGYAGHRGQNKSLNPPAEANTAKAAEVPFWNIVGYPTEYISCRGYQNDLPTPTDGIAPNL